MSHKCVEAVIGKLATDEAFRRRFLEDPASAVSELRRWLGYELTPVEAEALTALDPDLIRLFATGIDRRLQKVDLGSFGKGD